ncbi:hypothetical protein IPM62_04460 [Candidatus Woesebacteria bacterium]|nr:MAG: hypothetical protein IPM62_04460 [Candidatus Woesebacteria bacterium]
MLKDLKKYINKRLSRTFWGHKEVKTKAWANKHLSGLFTYNIILILLVLLHSAGYFHPFLPLTINIIVMISLILAVIMLGATSKVIFVISLFFLAFAELLLALGVGVWAERTMIYMFQAFILGLTISVYEFYKCK